MAHMHSALQLTEIKLGIAVFLHNADLKNCILVCRDWWITFEPLICHDARFANWRRTDNIFGPQGQPANDDDDDNNSINNDMDCFSSGQDPSLPRQPSAVSLIRHRQKVYRFDYHDLFYRVKFSNLQQLTICSRIRGSKQLTRFIKFINGCRNSLQVIAFWACRDLPDRRLWDALATLPNIKALHIYRGWLFKYDTVVSFWNLCTKLESLRLMSTEISSGITDSIPKLVLSNLRELIFERVEMELHIQARIIAHCTQLRRLLWKSSLECEETLDELSKQAAYDFIIQGRLSKLKALIICFASDALWIFTELRKLLNYSSSILNFYDVKTIQNYFPNLTEADIDVSLDECRHLVVLLLSSCTQLHTISTPLLKASDMMILRSQVWACKGLKRLCVCFLLDMIPGVLQEESNQLILEQISTLTKLEFLLLCPDIDERLWDTGNSLSIDLLSGMDILAGLKSLRGVALPDNQHWTRAEADWVIKHWTRLTDLHGIGEDNTYVEQGVKEVMEKHDKNQEQIMESYPSSLLSMASFE